MMLDPTQLVTAGGFVLLLVFCLWLASWNGELKKRLDSVTFRVFDVEIGATRADKNMLECMGSLEDMLVGRMEQRPSFDSLKALEAKIGDTINSAFERVFNDLAEKVDVATDPHTRLVLIEALRSVGERNKALRAVAATLETPAT